ncbi:MAG TPA: anti-sigma factor [Thermomicrobiales bacterium]|nr:anti-sigma factor [Thermomicrobiales bacterium]
MNDLAHGDVAERLPEYALGLLDGPEADAVASHLRACPACRRDLAELEETAGLLAFAAPPARPTPAAKAALFARIADLERPGPETAAGGEPAPAPPRGRGGRPRWLRVVPALAVAAALALLLGWNVAVQRQLNAERDRTAALTQQVQTEDAIARLIQSPTSAHSLTDSNLTPRPVGYIYTDPRSATALMLAYRMPPLAPGQRYQLWLIRTDGGRDSGGLFTVDERGDGQMIVHAPQPFGHYRSVGVTAEPWDGSPAPTTPRVVGGAIQ